MELIEIDTYCNYQIIIKVLLFYSILLFISHFSSDCQYTTLIKNGFCNDESNNEDCDYDGGDCCGFCIAKDHCSECACIADGSPDSYANVWLHGLSNILVGNGFCNDETNKEDCDYDGGDCCASNIQKDYCSECSCHGKYDPVYASIQKFDIISRYTLYIKGDKDLIADFLSQLKLVIGFKIFSQNVD